MPEPEQAISATASCSIFIVGLLGCGLVSCVEECSETEIETTSPSPMCINRPRSDLSKSEGRVDGRSRADAYVLPESKSVGGLFSSVVCIWTSPSGKQVQERRRSRCVVRVGRCRGKSGKASTGSNVVAAAHRAFVVDRFAFESSRVRENWRWKSRSFGRPFLEEQGLVLIAQVPRPLWILEGTGLFVIAKDCSRQATIQVVRLKAFLFATDTRLSIS